VLILLPIAWMVLSSFKPSSEVTAYPPTLVFAPTLDNYRQLFGTTPFAHYTLNSLDLQQDEGIAYSPADDQYRQDLFYRYNQNFQDFFDASARVETTFA